MIHAKYLVCTSKGFGHEVLLIVPIELVRGHVFEGCALQAWLCETGQNGPKFLDGPKDQTGRDILPPTLAAPNLNIFWSQISGRPFRPRTNQSIPSPYNTVMDQSGRSANVSQDHLFPQLRPAASVPMQDYSKDVDQVLVPHMSPYTTSLNAYEQHLGHFSSSVGDASDESDLSRTLHNTPELSPSSRTSSVSAISDAYLPARSPSYRTFQSVPSSPYGNLNSSVSSSSSLYSPSRSRNRFGSTHMVQGTASDEAYKVIIRHVPAGVTQKELSEQLDQKMPRYVRHERPKQGEDNKWSVEFFKEEDAEKTKERLHNLELKGRKLKVHVAPRRRINSGGSTTSATSSSTTSGPTIVDGSLTS